MAEFAIATGVLQVASAGISLTKALYDFGTTALAAGEQTDFIAKNISLYCRVLKTLARQLKVDNPDHSAEALDVAQELQEQSNHLFEKIRELLPPANGEKDGLSFKQKLMWNFRKSRVDYLVGQLEYLKSTVTLLLHVLSSVPKLRKYKRSKKKSPELRDEIDEELTEAQNLLYERCQAQNRLPELAVHDNAGTVPAIASGSGAETLPPAPGVNLGLRKSSEHTLAEIDAYAAQITGDDSRAVIMQNTAVWLAQLYEQWTTLSQKGPGNDIETPSEEGLDELTVPGLSKAGRVPIVADSEGDVKVEERRATPRAAETPLQDIEHGQEDRRRPSWPHAERVHALPTGPKAPGDQHPQPTFEFGGGDVYDDCVVTLKGSSVLKELNIVKHAIEDSYAHDPPVMVDEQRRLSRLKTSQQQLEQEYQTHELIPLRKAYFKRLRECRESYGPLLRRLQAMRDTPFRSSETWLKVQDIIIPQLNDHFEWLQEAREEYSTLEEHDVLTLGPSRGCPDAIVRTWRNIADLDPTATCLPPLPTSTKAELKTEEKRTADKTMKDTTVEDLERGKLALRDAKHSITVSSPSDVFERRRDGTNALAQAKRCAKCIYEVLPRPNGPPIEARALCEECRAKQPRSSSSHSDDSKAGEKPRARTERRRRHEDEAYPRPSRHRTEHNNASAEGIYFYEKKVRDLAGTERRPRASHRDERDSRDLKKSMRSKKTSRTAQEPTQPPRLVGALLSSLL